MDLKYKGLRLQIVLTTKCNNLCYFCPIVKPNIRSISMDSNTINSIYEVAKNHGNCTFITLTGGEAIFHPQFSEVILKFREMFPDIFIQANTNFQHNLFEQLPLDVIKNINFLSITLHDQYVEDYDIFFKKVKNLKGIKDINKQVSLMLTRTSYENVINIYNKYKDNFNVILKYIYEDEEFLKSAGNNLILEALHAN